MRERYGEVTKQILLVIGVAGVVVLLAAAPGAVQIAKLFPHNQRHSFKKTKHQSVARSIRGLEKNKLLVINRGEGGKTKIRLTKKGKQKFREIQLHNLMITKPPRWDHKWRIVIFDIPENSSKPLRETLRAKLKQWEFYQLQKSVWVCPWPCEDEIQLVAELYDITPYLNTIIAEKILGDTSLRKHFGL
jgi:CRISPR-associated endonuclease Cas2